MTVSIVRTREDIAEDANALLWSERESAVARGVASATRIFSSAARNAELWDANGKRYVDFAAGIAVVNTGHCHPRVIAAVKQQLEQFTHTCFQVTPAESYVRLAQRLNKLVPGQSAKKTILLTTGAEAVENAIKIARAHRQAPGVIAFTGAFHGRTMMAMALTGKVAPYKLGFGPFPGEVYHLPFPIAYHGVTAEQSLAALQSLFRADLPPERVAAIILEPVQGEGGFYVAPSSFLRALRELCDEHGIVLILDEIHTAFGRTGRMFACEHAGIEPDLVCMAKGLSGGFPLAAVTGKAEIMDAPVPGGLGGTFGGSPIGCAAAHAVLDVIEDEALLLRAEKIGAQIIDRLDYARTTLPEIAPYIGDIRGLGSMIALEFTDNGDPDRPLPDLAKRVVAACTALGLLLLSCGVRGNVVRFLPPLTAPDDIVQEGMDIFETALRESL